MKFFFCSLLAFALIFTACNGTKSSGDSPAQPSSDPVATTTTEPAAELTIEDLDAKYADYQKAYLAGGCFWCTEAAIDRIQGVADVYSGYAGGEEENPTYRQVASGQTGHAEAIVVYFDPEVLPYDELLDVFFVAHDPTQLNRQGPDKGKQYRGAIFPLSEEQERVARAKIAELNASGKYDQPLATTIEDPIRFYVAEAYHQDYYEDPTNPNQSYVQNVSRPKVEKVMRVFADRLKPEFQ